MDVTDYLPLKSRTLSVLTALAHEPLHGYAVMTRLREEPGTGGIGPASLYRSLHDLERRGLIRAKTMGAAPRRGATFELTEAGREVLRAELARLDAVTSRARQALEGTAD